MVTLINTGTWSWTGHSKSWETAFQRKAPLSAGLGQGWGERWNKTDEGIQRYKLPVKKINKSRRCNVQHGNIV